MRSLSPLPIILKVPSSREIFARRRLVASETRSAESSMIVIASVSRNPVVVELSICASSSLIWDGESVTTTFLGALGIFTLEKGFT